MNIRRLEKDEEKRLSIKFQNDLLSASNLVPGDYKTLVDIPTVENSYHFMSSSDIKKNLEETFGLSKNTIKGKNGAAKLLAFSFNNEVIIVIIASKDSGAKWYWVDSNDDGSRYEKPTLLPCDKEISYFWPDFCVTLSNLLFKKI